jgi:hypothetical protein
VKSKEVPPNMIKEVILRFLNNFGVQMFLIVLLLLSLFLPDSWILGNAPEQSDDALSGIMLSIFIIFMIEFLLLSYAQEDYAGSVYFWLDLLGNLSLIIDIAWIANGFIPPSQDPSVVRTIRTLKLGARYGRLLRLIRFVRMIHSISPSSDENNNSNNNNNRNNNANSSTIHYEPTLTNIQKISTELSQFLSLQMILLVVFLIIIVPFINYNEKDISYSAWVINCKITAKNPNATVTDLERIGWKLHKFYEDKDTRVSSVSIESPYVSSSHYETTYPTDHHPLRSDNVISYHSTYYIASSVLQNSNNPFVQEYLTTVDLSNEKRAGFLSFDVIVDFDETIKSEKIAMYNILIIIVAILVMLGCNESFQRSVTRRVVLPLEKTLAVLRTTAVTMMKSLKELEAAKEEEEEEKHVETIPRKEGETIAVPTRKRRDSGKEREEAKELESAELEKIVEKLTRIVRHVAPNARHKSEVHVDSGHLDTTTANWLSQQFDTRVSVKKAGRDEEQPLRRRMSSSAPLLEENNNTTDLLLSPEIAEGNLSLEVQRQFSTWGLDVLQFSHEELHSIVFALFAQLQLFETFHVPTSVFNHFIREISLRYLSSNSYHTYRHGVDVLFTCFRIVTVVPGFTTTIFSPLELLSLFVGAISHDVGHPGLNNVYLTKAKHALAIEYNDRSPLENMHCKLLYEKVLSKKEMNIFQNLTEKEWREARRMIITVILGTDMSQHFEQINKMQLFNEIHGEDCRAFCFGEKKNAAEGPDCFKNDDKNRLFILEMILHVSDISNPLKPFNICEQWAHLIAEEFSRQGDREKDEGLEISPMCDRATLNLFNMQMGFIEFVVSPLIIGKFRSLSFLSLFIHIPNLFFSISLSVSFCQYFPSSS